MSEFGGISATVTTQRFVTHVNRRYDGVWCIVGLSLIDIGGEEGAAACCCSYCRTSAAATTAAAAAEVMVGGSRVGSGRAETGAR